MSDLVTVISLKNPRENYPCVWPNVFRAACNQLWNVFEARHIELWRETVQLAQ